jgi:hypothetical protein
MNKSINFFMLFFMLACPIFAIKVSVVENTDYCMTDCYTTYKVEDVKDFTTFATQFKDKEEKAKSIKYEISSRTDTRLAYEKSETLLKASKDTVRYIRIDGKKKASESIDNVICLDGTCFKEFIWWNGTYKRKMQVNFSNTWNITVTNRMFHVTLNTANKNIDSTCSNINFFNGAENATLSYMVVSCNNTDNSNFNLVIPSCSALSNCSFYFYYDNQTSVTDANNITFASGILDLQYYFSLDNSSEINMTNHVNSSSTLRGAVNTNSVTGVWGNAKNCSYYSDHNKFLELMTHINFQNATMLYWSYVYDNTLPYYQGGAWEGASPYIWSAGRLLTNYLYGLNGNPEADMEATGQLPNQIWFMHTQTFNVTGTDTIRKMYLNRASLFINRTTTETASSSVTNYRFGTGSTNWNNDGANENYDEIQIYKYNMSVNEIGFIYDTYNQSFYTQGIEVNYSHAPQITQQNTFTNATIGHSFLVNATAYDEFGATDIASTNASTTSGSCDYVSNSTSGTNLTVTYNCSGVGLSVASVQIGFIDTLNAYNSTTASTNTFPNKAPQIAFNNSFNNDTWGNSTFLVSAGCEDNDTALDIASTNCTTTSGSCDYVSNSTSGNSFNVTWRCTGIENDTATVSCLFTDLAGEFIATPPTDNTYPCNDWEAPYFTDMNNITNCTNVGENITFIATFHDDLALALAVFSWNESGSLVNDTSFLIFSENTSDLTYTAIWNKTANTLGYICAGWYVQDAFNRNNYSYFPNCFYVQANCNGSVTPPSTTIDTTGISNMMLLFVLLAFACFMLIFGEMTRALLPMLAGAIAIMFFGFAIASYSIVFMVLALFVGLLLGIRAFMR